MSRNQKILFTIVGCVALLSCTLCVAGVFIVPRLWQNAFSNNPTQAKEVAAQIADYTLPAGYQESVGMDVFVYKAVVIARPDRRGLNIMLMQFNSSDISREEMEQQLRAQSQLQGYIGPMQWIGSETVTIKGKSVTLNILEGQGNRNSAATIRQAQGVFQGKGGTVALLVTAPVSNWDKDLIAKFCESIR